MDKIINLLINNWTKGVDTYTHNGSTWLIFTEQRSWVIELTESKTLWYNYNFFRELFSLTSMDVVENQHYITKWVENNITNGVRHIDWCPEKNNGFFDDAIKNGVKETYDDVYHHKGRVDGVIDNGVKETKYNQSHQEPKFKEVLKYGTIMSNPRQYVTNKIIDDTIQNGIKETKTPGEDGDILSTIEWMDENKTNSVPKLIDNVIEKGEKINGIFVGGKIQKENIEVVIDYGVKKIKADSSQNPMGKVTDVIKNGVKETKVCNFLDPNTNLVYVRWPEDIEEVIDYGTKNPSV